MKVEFAEMKGAELEAHLARERAAIAARENCAECGAPRNVAPWGQHFCGIVEMLGGPTPDFQAGSWHRGEQLTMPVEATDEHEDEDEAEEYMASIDSLDAMVVVYPAVPVMDDKKVDDLMAALDLRVTVFGGSVAAWYEDEFGDYDDLRIDGGANARQWFERKGLQLTRMLRQGCKTFRGGDDPFDPTRVIGVAVLESAAILRLAGRIGWLDLLGVKMVDL